MNPLQIEFLINEQSRSREPMLKLKRYKYAKHISEKYGHYHTFIDVELTLL